MTSKPEISLADARRIAEKHATAFLDIYAAGKDSVLQSFYLEAKNCWMFFKDPKIVIPDHALLGIQWAYAVSKHGNMSIIQDFSYDKDRLLEYLQTMSDYFDRKGL